ncbi:hypothetical protein CO611_02415 [Lysobacteraceae bacterium NML03-0222]|nr:hypothetical protein CO611_02415 [Xanthomonadaceae bacterium NML03-0222]
MSHFERDQVRAFRFVRRGMDLSSGTIELAYAFDDGAELVERITIPGAPFELDTARSEALECALTLLHLIAGVSYYKAAVPGEIRVEYTQLDEATTELLDTIYLQGLGEFAYRNGLDLRARIRFPRTGKALPQAAAIGQRQHALVAIGGGKDSLVSIETLRRAGVEQTVTWIGNSQLIRACAEHTGLPTLNISRQLAPALFEMNRAGAWNGHIPVTAINSAIMVVAAILSGADQVVFSNERSASYGSLIAGSGEVNHQWSKGWDFERRFGEYVSQHVAADLHYYSLLRPLSELAVARQFAKSSHYDAHFSSCNRNFHILGERPASRWCGVCPKCHFVFLALAPFMPKPRLTAIFGRNLLDCESEQAGFDALMEYHDHKPFECVGEARESRAAMAQLAERPEWREDALVRRFAREIAPQLVGEDLSLEALLRADGEHRIPPALWERVRADFAV